MKNPFTNEIDMVKKQIGDSEPFTVSCIPFNESNTDYQEYLAWVAEGNTAEAAD